MSFLSFAIGLGLGYAGYAITQTVLGSTLASLSRKMNPPVKAQLGGLLVVVVVLGVAFGAYYLSASSALAGRDQSISSLQSQVSSLQHLPASTTTVTTSVSTVLTSSATVTNTVSTTVTTTSTYSPDKIVQVLSVRANLTRIGSTSNYSLLFVVVWKNISNSTIYYFTECGGGQLASSILPTSTAKVAIASQLGCDLVGYFVAMKPGDNATSMDPGRWDQRSYVLTGSGRVDASLMLLWKTSPGGPPFDSMTFYYSFQV